MLALLLLLLLSAAVLMVTAVTALSKLLLLRCRLMQCSLLAAMCTAGIVQYTAHYYTALVVVSTLEWL
jgi:hypothetical protein